MRNILDKYFKHNPSQLIHFIKQDIKLIEKINLNEIHKNRICKKIIRWKKKCKENLLIKIYRDIMKINKIKTKNKQKD